MIKDFAVVRPNDFPQGRDASRSCKVGEVLELERITDNKYDPYSIAVKVNGTYIGYVPNRGYMCMNCLGKVDINKDDYCPSCGSDSRFFTVGGVARQLCELGLFDGTRKYTCFVKSVSPASKDVVIKATVAVED